jgi:5-methylcytosine-specific restriction enzyme subunit McrC
MIRVENIYYLLCYAWNHAELASAREVSGISSNRMDHLLAYVLAERVGELLRRGLHREYRTVEEQLSAPRGKMDVSATLKRGLIGVGRVACRVDELDHDLLLNQIIRATIERLLSAIGDRELTRRLGDLRRRLPQIAPLDVRVEHVARAQLHRHNAHYRFVLHLCELLLRQLLPQSAGGRYHFIDFRGDERAMGLLFEAFVRHFLIREQRHFKVTRDQLHWMLDPLTPLAKSVLPAMQTDIMRAESASSQS